MMQYQQISAQPDAQIMPALAESALPEGFVYLDEAVRGVTWDAKYATADNVTGAPVPGYETNRIALSLEMVAPLKKAMALADEAGYSLLIWDTARPQRAVDAFMAWSEAPEDGATKAAHYPRVDKADLFKLGYIAKKSGHTRGAAIDLTLTDKATGEALDMGTGFDFMDVLSHHGAKGLTQAQRENRSTLLKIMEGAGFKRYDREWWHYTLNDEPHPGTYFDFMIGE